MYVSIVLQLVALGSGTGGDTGGDLEGPQLSETAAIAELAPAVWWEPFGFTVSLESAVGIGTFVANEKADNPYYGSTLSLEPSWGLTEQITLGIGVGLTYEWTYLVTPCHPASGPRPEGAPKEDCSDSDDPNGRQWFFDDIVLSADYDSIYDLGPVSFVGGMSVALPTSQASRHTDNLFTLGLSQKTKLDLEPFSASLRFGFQKFFPTAEAQVLDAVEAQEGSIIGRCSSFRSESCVALSGFVSTYQLKSDLSASVDIVWIDGLSATVAFGYIYSRRFGRDRDQFSSTRVDADGETLVSGVSADDSTVGNVDITYELGDHVSFSFGIYSLQPAKTEDGKSLRFPFFDFVSPANNFTTWYLSGSYTL